MLNTKKQKLSAFGVVGDLKKILTNLKNVFRKKCLSKFQNLIYIGNMKYILLGAAIAFAMYLGDKYIL